MKKFGLKAFALAMTAIILLCACNSEKYEYETVENDPLKAKIYTLPNGLKVYMTVNKDEPRIQTCIAVRVGGKNDPAETTGLAHYFEHLMFKGTKDFGTTNYEAEKPMLDKIEELFEIYRKTEDEAQRKAIYKQIDSISYEASKLAIPNEYDKLMSAIGANGTNAYTSYDVTCYVEDIPSNQIENWAKIQANRFEFPVIRGFHTELETIYEEKNMSLTNDSRKVYEAMHTLLYPNHPYGTQTVLGTQEHLKNPSITNVKNYHAQWYVPNNMAICVSGDFDPDNMIDIITKYFGQLKPNPELPVLNFANEAPITSPKSQEVLGLEAEQLLLAWRFPGQASHEAETLEMVSWILNNGDAGLIDLNINQQQKALSAGAGVYGQSVYSSFIMLGRPKQGQSLDDVKELLLGELKNLREGNFSDDLIEATINNMKLYAQQQLESNYSRADMFVNSFVNGSDWKDEVSKLDRMAKTTKQDIVDFACKYLTDSNYVAIYKRQGKDPNELKIAKPQLTPIVMNRDTTSLFLREIQATKVTPIEPVFIDFEKDLTFLNTDNDIQVLYKKNESNDIFQLTYVFDRGSWDDKRLGTASGYLDLLGTDDMTPEQFKQEFYKLACTYRMSVGGQRSYIILSGLSENMPQALDLFEKLLSEAKPDSAAYQKYVDRILKSRQDSKANQRQNFSRLTQYAMYGENSPTKDIIGENELRQMNPKVLTDLAKEFNSYQHRIIYYGPMGERELVDNLNKHHKTPEALKPTKRSDKFKQKLTDETIVFVAPYDAKQIYMTQYSNKGEKYNPLINPISTLYNEYFGGNMSSIVFQEMRESRGLAYSAWTSYMHPSYIENDYFYYTQIATQNDKMMDAISAFNEIINNMPVSQPAFKLAKESLEARLRTERIIKDQVAWAYINAQDLEENVDSRIALFEALPTLTLDDVVKFQQEYIKDRTYYYCILGDKNDLDIAALEKIGKVVFLTTEDIFGY